MGFSSCHSPRFTLTLTLAFLSMLTSLPQRNLGPFCVFSQPGKVQAAFSIKEPLTSWAACSVYIPLMEISLNWSFSLSWAFPVSTGQLTSASVSLLWLLQQSHTLFSGPHFPFLPRLPTYQQLECRSQSPQVLPWHPAHSLSHGWCWVEKWGIVQSFQEAQFAWVDGKWPLV